MKKFGIAREKNELVTTAESSLLTLNLTRRHTGSTEKFMENSTKKTQQ